MNNKKLPIVVRSLSVLLIIILAGCSHSPQPKTEYKKITPREAQIMMVTINPDKLIILDVRTQEEFDKGYIKNAVLLPDYEIKEKAESVIADKNQTVLVYCQTGVRSETVSKELIEMGYTNVFDFGGIVDWTREIGWDDSDTVFYNYFGGELPPDIITPINYVMQKKINEQLPEFTFMVIGTNTKQYGVNHDKGRYYISNDIYEISSIITKSEDEKYNQELTFEKTQIFHNSTGTYGFDLNDWNFDGYLDISLWVAPGGTSLNSPHYYWLWDNDEGRYARNEALEKISDSTYLEIDIENKQIIAAQRRSGGYYHGYYELKSGQYILVKTEDMYAEINAYTEKTRVHYVTKELINGKMTVTKDYYEDASD